MPPPPPRAPSVPVPETWVVSGQSNAVSCGPRTFIGVPYAGCTEAAWSTAVERLGLPITLSGWAKGSEPIDHWGYGWNNWQFLLSEIRQANNFTTFLWWQGEAEATNGQAGSYGAMLRDLIYRVRMTTPSVHIKVVIVGLLDAPGNYPDYDVVRNAQRAFVTADSNAVFIDTRGIRLNPASPFHLDADGYCEVGERIAEALRDPYQTPN